MHGIDNRIRQRMTDTGTSVKALSEATAIPRMTLSRRLVDPDTLALAEVDRIAAALETTALWLLTGLDAA